MSSPSPILNNGDTQSIGGDITDLSSNSSNNATQIVGSTTELLLQQALIFHRQETRSLQETITEMRTKLSSTESSLQQCNIFMRKKNDRITALTKENLQLKLALNKLSKTINSTDCVNFQNLPTVDCSIFGQPTFDNNDDDDDFDEDAELDMPNRCSDDLDKPGPSIDCRLNKASLNPRASEAKIAIQQWKLQTTRTGNGTSTTDHAPDDPHGAALAYLTKILMGGTPQQQQQPDVLQANENGSRNRDVGNFEADQDSTARSDDCWPDEVDRRVTADQSNGNIECGRQLSTNDAMDNFLAADEEQEEEKSIDPFSAAQLEGIQGLSGSGTSKHSDCPTSNDIKIEDTVTSVIQDVSSSIPSSTHERNKYNALPSFKNQPGISTSTSSSNQISSPIITNVTGHFSKTSGNLAPKSEMGAFHNSNSQFGNSKISQAQSHSTAFDHNQAITTSVQHQGAAGTGGPKEQQPGDNSGSSGSKPRAAPPPAGVTINGVSMSAMDVEEVFADVTQDLDAMNAMMENGSGATPMDLNDVIDDAMLLRDVTGTPSSTDDTAPSLHDIFSSSATSIGGGATGSGTQHSCAVCGRTYPTAQKMENHMRRHSLSRPYKCVYCPKSFTHLSVLDSHIIALHTHAYPYHCAYCNKGYIRPILLKKHMRSAHRAPSDARLPPPRRVTTAAAASGAAKIDMSPTDGPNLSQVEEQE